METERQKDNVKIRVNGKVVEFDRQVARAREILDAAGYEGQFCLAATVGESGKIDRQFANGDDVDLGQYKHFRATFCGPEVVS